MQGGGKKNEIAEAAKRQRAGRLEKGECRNADAAEVVPFWAKGSRAILDLR
jgi:hypothetical protein